MASPPPPGTPFRMTIRLARGHAETVRCQYLIAEIYNRYYDIVFSHDIVDLNARIEPYPHRYAMGVVGDTLVAAAGLYTRDTYVERFGHVRDEEIERLIEASGSRGVYSAHRKHEYTKLVVRPGWEGLGIGRFFFAATHSRHFIEAGSREPVVLVSCAKESIFRNLYDVVGIKTRQIKPFPTYRVHDRYRTPGDPMESRLILPERDIAPRWYDLDLPGEYEVALLAEGVHGG